MGVRHHTGALPLIPGIGPSTARIMLVGEAPGPEESARREPFVGSSGLELSRMLHDAGISRSDIFLTNLFRTPLPKDPRTGQPDLESIFHFPIKAKQRGLPDFLPWNNAQLHKPRFAEVELLAREIDLIKPNVIIPVGNAALWYFTGKSGISTWRSSLLGGGSGPKIIPTYNPAAVLRQYELRDITVHDLKRAAAHQHSRLYTPPAWNFIIRPDFGTVVKTLLELLARASEGPLPLVLDIETRRGHTACLGLAWSALDAICIPFMCSESPSGYWDLSSEAWIVHTLQRLLLHPNVLTIGQNLIYDYQYLWRHWGFFPSKTRDTMINHHLAWPGLPKALDFQASMYCEHYVYWKDDGKEWHEKQDEEELWRYNATDCVRTWECDQSTWGTVQQFGLEPLSHRRHVHMLNCLRTMFRGVRIDEAARASFSASLAGELKAREDRLEAYTGQRLNPRSPKQMMSFLYDDLKLPVQYNRKARPPRPSADDEALSKLALREPILFPIVRTLSESRSIGVFRSTFVEAALDPTDRRMRCSYNICGTETFRLSSSENAFGSGTNLQNVPKGDDAGLLPNVRRLFVPDSGYFIFDTDLDRADLQVVVWEADDEELRAALREGVDIHTLNAKALGVSRQLAKSWVHGTNYGGGPRTMAAACGITVHQAERMQARWFQAHPGIKHWHVRTENQLRTSRSVSNRFGYRRVYFGRVDGLLPEALAWVPQSTVAICINEIWDEIVRRAPWIEILLQVHDSLVGQFPREREAEAREVITSAASAVTIPYPLPLTIPAGIKVSAVSWGDVE